MDDRLDALLDQSGPPVARRTPQLARTLVQLVDETERARPARKAHSMRRRAAISLAAVTGVLALGTAATAGGLLDLAPQPSSGQWDGEPGVKTASVLLSNGAPCVATYAIAPDLARGFTAHITARDWDETMDAAQHFLASLDMSTIDADAAFAKYETARRKSLRSDWYQALPPEERGPDGSTADERRVEAVGAELYARVQANLRSKGLDPSALSMTISNRCNFGDDR